MEIKAIIWDLGNVLIDWNPAYVFNRLIEDPERRSYFFRHICTSDWNENQDAGRPIREATEELVQQHPEWKELIEAYYGQWTDMLGGPIQGTVDLFAELRSSRPYKHYALTNWSAELFPIALERYDFLHWFDGRVVSGEEKMRKPTPAFYQLILDRYSLQPQNTLFIDDNLRNIKAAAAMGIHSLAFESSEQLREQLIEKAIL